MLHKSDFPSSANSVPFPLIARSAGTRSNAGLSYSCGHLWPIHASIGAAAVKYVKPPSA